MCNVQAVFSLILVGELLAFAFVVIDHGLNKFEWLHFGIVSFLVQWVVLVSAAVLCPLRPWFRNQNGIVAGSVSYLIVLCTTGAFSVAGMWFLQGHFVWDSSVLFENLVIAAIFAGVVLRYFYLQQQLNNREQAELQSRIQALQSRIRPHFLFNSMNSIASLIDIDPEAAEKMVVDLSQLFRASLREATLVPLDEEITLCRQFVSIEKTRLGERLSVDWDLELKDESISIPSLLLQPLIENAIYHGIQPLPEGGKVTVAIRSNEGKVSIQVHNPLDRAYVSENENNNGVALENIQHRLQAHYGDKAYIRCTDSDTEFLVDIAYQSTEQNKAG